MKNTTNKVPVKTKENKETVDVSKLYKDFVAMQTKFMELERDTKDLRQMYNYHKLRQTKLANAILAIQL